MTPLFDPHPISLENLVEYLKMDAVLPTRGDKSRSNVWVVDTWRRNRTTQYAGAVEHWAC